MFISGRGVELNVMYRAAGFLLCFRLCNHKLKLESNVFSLKLLKDVAMLSQLSTYLCFEVLARAKSVIYPKLAKLLESRWTLSIPAPSERVFSCVGRVHE